MQDIRCFYMQSVQECLFDISTYHYPVTAAIIIILTLFVIQMLLAIFIAKSVRKDSLIERIRFSE